MSSLCIVCFISVISFISLCLLCYSDLSCQTVTRVAHYTQDNYRVIIISTEQLALQQQKGKTSAQWQQAGGKLSLFFFSFIPLARLSLDKLPLCSDIKVSQYHKCCSQFSPNILPKRLILFVLKGFVKISLFIHCFAGKSCLPWKKWAPKREVQTWCTIYKPGREQHYYIKDWQIHFYCKYCMILFLSANWSIKTTPPHWLSTYFHVTSQDRADQWLHPNVFSGLLHIVTHMVTTNCAPPLCSSDHSRGMTDPFKTPNSICQAWTALS